MLTPRKYEKHGKTNTRAYWIWIGMMNRCYRKTTTHFDRYGGRGISVCERWKNSFQAFLDDMGEPPPKMTLERKENDKDYSKDNCRWASRWEQSLNRKNTVSLTFKGVTKPLPVWAKETGLTRSCIYYRKYVVGLSDDECLSRPARNNHRTITHNGKTYTTVEAAKIIGISITSLHLRIRKGWTTDEIFNRPNSQPYKKPGWKFVPQTV